MAGDDHEKKPTTAVQGAADARAPSPPTVRMRRRRVPSGAVMPRSFRPSIVPFRWDEFGPF
jgi:hypothetical protein